MEIPSQQRKADDMLTNHTHTPGTVKTAGCSDGKMKPDRVSGRPGDRTAARKGGNLSRHRREEGRTPRPESWRRNVPGVSKEQQEGGVAGAGSEAGLERRSEMHGRRVGIRIFCSE